MDMVDIIQKKRDGGELTDEEITYVINGFTAGNIPDYQMSALLMAILFRNMTRREIFSLTRAMRDSGDTIDLSVIPGIKVDKHSSGGVGDKTTLVAAPVAAALGVPVAKMSGRGLGFTGGTIDKLESIPGMRTNLSVEQFVNQVHEIGIAVTGQTGKIAPADKKIYALRDVTGTVDSIPLIASSIMSKKLAAGTDAIVLDVKCGRGAFMRNQEAADFLARLMISIARENGKKAAAIISGMDEPLGYAVGNSLEVAEAIDTLKGNGPADLTKLSISIAGLMAYEGEKVSSLEEGVEKAQEVIADGTALLKLRQMILYQNGDDSVIDDTSILGIAAASANVRAGLDGYVTAVDALRIGNASRHTGAGREEKGDAIDETAGIVLKKKVGSEVKKDDVLAVVYAADHEKARAAAQEAAVAFAIGPEKPAAQNIVKDIIAE
ncbi:MAG: thymidine phosphorylase [Anaerovoracaceae bacterium]